MLIHNIQADDDEGDVLDDIFVDLVIGFGIAVCDEYETCRDFMIIFGVVSTIFISVGICFGSIRYQDIYNKKNILRGGTVYGGYSLTKRAYG